VLPSLGTHQVDKRNCEVEHELSCHKSIGCPIYDCILRYSDIDADKIGKHRAVHKVRRMRGLPDPSHWVEVPHGREENQSIISPLQDGPASDGALIMDSSAQSAETVDIVTESLLEHPSDE
jgi:hypothetical protein